ncbi:MAG: oxygen-independent coproporphyrinogen III oxidase [Rickettsiales bacterium]|nr:oxygen-independent coproporphyrinogen III oxidase [Rickettsiales bacterium]
MNNQVHWDRALIEKYSISGPRYTSYPTALQFDESFTSSNMIEVLNSSDKSKPISLYVHIPFCENICYYCACNKVITKDRSKAVHYIEALLKEAEQIAPLLAGRLVTQMHWGGGTPTFLTNEEIKQVTDRLKELFKFSEKSEISIEIDPRSMDRKTLPALAKLGFNRLSLGVQDFNPKVQKSVNRIQPYEMTRKALLDARKYGFESINIDLIYGLPFQSVETFKETIRQVIEMAPDRLSVFNYAHLPHRFKPQRRINADELPSGGEKIAILEMTIKKLTEAGYVYIGMDHFALPHDELTLAQEHGDLHRNFQGYTTNADCDLIGLGVSSISKVSDSYYQNERDLKTYYAHIDNNEYATWRGYELTEDDKIRRDVIMHLICQFNLEFRTVEKRYGIVFSDYFKDELDSFDDIVSDGLAEITAEGIQVSQAGRLLIRNICMIFDQHFKQLKSMTIYSAAI